MTGVSQDVQVYLSRFAELESNPQAPAWLQRIRRSGMEDFAERGFPTTRLEDWKFTSLAPLTRFSFDLAAGGSNGWTTQEVTRLPLADLGCPRLAFVNGRYCPELCSGPLPAGVRAGSLASALDNPLVEEHLGRYARAQDNALVALNTAFLRDGAFVEIARGALIEEPIHLLFLTTAEGPPAVSHPRNLILIGRDSQASFIESYLGLHEQVYFTNAVSEIVAGENSVVDHYRLQQESGPAFHLGAMHVHQHGSSAFTSHSLSLGGTLARIEITAVLDAEGAECALHGLYVAGGEQHVDNRTALDHAKPHCSSREVYRGILDGKATAVFNGKIIVRKDAQKTDAKQTNKNLLLSSGASINTKPQLEIYADDVKCTHGATIGQLGEELIFYLRSRGISHEQARSLLTYAFAGDTLARMKFEPLRSRLESRLLAWLENGHKAGERS